jgi:hypothetical protein
MVILKKIYPILLLPIVSACEEVFTPDIPYEPMLCVNSLITVGEPIEIEVSKSRLYTDSYEKSEVNDANVKIYANGTLQLDSYIPKEGDNIKIVAESPSVGRGEAEVLVPRAISTPTATWKVLDMDYWESESEIVNARFDLQIDLKIEDPAGENFYKLSFECANDDVVSDDLSASGNYGFELGSFKNNMEPIFSEHIGIFESIMGGDADGFTFFSDRQFAGKSYTLHLEFDNCRYCYPRGMEPNCAVLMIVNSVSPSYYNWANYTWQRDNGTLTDFSDYGLGDAIWGYSNVSSGAGVVAAQSKSICTIDLTDSIQKTIK